MEGFDDADPDSDYDYEETYSKKRKKRGAPGKPPKSSTMSDSPHAKKGTKVFIIKLRTFEAILVQFANSCFVFIILLIIVYIYFFIKMSFFTNIFK